jgi:glycosyltransferase involved in cell wall biosynthesis
MSPARDRKRVLMITYVFPPSGWVGGRRTHKYCKYLGAHGWEPVVLTAQTTGVTFKDDALLRQLPPDLQVFRTFDLDPAKWEDWLAQRARRGGGNGSSQAAMSGTSSGGAPRRKGLWTRAKDLLKSLLKESPDSHLFWVPFAFLTGVRIMLTRRIDVIYCSSPPHSSHLIAYLLAKCFRKPYVIDFRDPWPVTGSHEQPSPTKLPRVLRWETRLKHRIVSGAAAVITASRGERDELVQEYPDVRPDRFEYITNGYDPGDFAPAPAGTAEAAMSGTLTVTHAGTIYSGTAGEFFEAIRRLVTERPGIESKLRIQLMGEAAIEYSDAVRELESGGIVRSLGLLPHAAALKVVMASDVLLILLGGDRFSPSELPSKVFEYLYAGKPVVAITQEGELAQVLQQSGLGVVLSPRSVDGIVDGLLRLCEEHSSGRLGRVPNRDYIRTFERAALAGKLAEILDGIAGRSTPQQP